MNLSEGCLEVKRGQGEQSRMQQRIVCPFVSSRKGSEQCDGVHLVALESDKSLYRIDTNALPTSTA